LGCNESYDVIQKVALSDKQVNSQATSGSLLCLRLSKATNTANGMTHHGETQRTSEKAVRKTKHSYNPTKANGYVAKSGTKTDDVLLLFKHNSHF